MEKEKRKLMDIINESSFALLDINLYLDTHPNDMEALRSYNDYKQIRNVAVKEYNTKYGPLNSFSVDSSNFEAWTSGPWPWEGGC